MTHEVITAHCIKCLFNFIVMLEAQRLSQTLATSRHRHIKICMLFSRRIFCPQKLLAIDEADSYDLYSISEFSIKDSGYAPIISGPWKLRGLDFHASCNVLFHEINIRIYLHTLDVVPSTCFPLLPPSSNFIVSSYSSVRFLINLDMENSKDPRSPDFSGRSTLEDQRFQPAKNPDVENQTGLDNNSSDTATSEKTPKDPNIVDWDGPDDPANPLNWSSAKKLAAIGIVSLVTMLS